ncbi:IS66 family insertion sequence element accessory protein TnpB [Pseudomonas cichorii]|uniref:IS66 family insertion sequence element accessory protein TnpB n=1 Tax=Pseudomonas cichorii TaxID=36746 RepID=UPI0021A9FA49|nr:IS66 family insertion sequence element accessory protein TnpB [Pseudomonas cichorii]
MISGAFGNDASQCWRRKVYFHPRPVDCRKSIDGLAALVELDIKVAVFDPVLFVFLNKSRNRIKVLYWAGGTNAGVSQRCCIKDGSRPPGVCLQELASNRPVLLRSKGVVVSDCGKGADRGVRYVLRR